MPLTSALSPEEKAKVKSAIPAATSKILFATIARLYYAYPQPHRWFYAGLQGALAFVLDLQTNATHFKLVDLDGTRGVIWVHELYGNLELHQDRPFFHSFAGDKCMIAFVYADELDAKTFYKKVKNNNKSSKGSKLKGEKRRKPSKSGKIDKSMISAPQKGSFIHIAHMGYDAESGFTSKGVDPSWTALLSDLESKVGRDVVEREIEYIKKFVRQFPEDRQPQSKVTKSADPPPPPRPRRSQAYGSVPPPPPPPIASKPNPAPPPPSRPTVPSRSQTIASKPPPPPRRPTPLAQNNPPPVRNAATPTPPPRPSVTHAPRPPPPSRPAFTSDSPTAALPLSRPVPPDSSTAMPPPPPPAVTTTRNSAPPPPPPPPPPPAVTTTSNSAPPPPPPPPPSLPRSSGETPPPTQSVVPTPQPGRSDLLASIQGKGIHSLRKTDPNTQQNGTPRDEGSTPIATTAVATSAVVVAAAAAGAGVAASSSGGDLTSALAAALLERNKRLGESDDDEDDDDDEWD